MWQLDWAARPPAGASPSSGRHPQADEHARPARVGGLMWEEHCHECAEPDCYASCPLYIRRRDGRCARLEYGIYPNPSFAGLFPFGADVKFRRWGKLESVLPVRAVSVTAARAGTRIDRRISAAARRVDAMRGWPARRQVTAAYRMARINALRPAPAPSTDFDEFLVEAWSPERESFRLVIECKCDGAPYFRESVAIAPGWNRIALPAAGLLAGATDRSARLLVYPESDARVRIVFTWLDLIGYAPSTTDAVPPQQIGATAAPRPADKVKCVVWDLDKTIWDGILADVGPDEVALVAGMRDVINALDERGIVQSVASKNDHEQAWPVIDRLGLGDMFLYPAINWGPKSQSIRSIAQALNIGLDTLAFVDDSPIERAQVAAELPEVRVYSEADIASFFELDEFDVRPSQEGKARRLSYLAEARRQAVLASSPTLPIEDFLRSCRIEVEMALPSDAASLDRCHELLMRSNQLNLSTRRHSRSELVALVADPARTALAVRVRDRFGDYGLVGFLSFGSSADGRVTVEDLVFSCRVAKKYVENAVFEAVREIVAENCPAIRMTFMPTARNGALLEALRTMALDGAEGSVDDARVLSLATDRTVPLSDVASAVHVEPAARDRIAAMLRETADRRSVPQPTSAS